MTIAIPEKAVCDTAADRLNSAANLLLGQGNDDMSKALTTLAGWLSDRPSLDLIDVARALTGGEPAAPPSEIRERAAQATHDVRHKGTLCSGQPTELDYDIADALAQARLLGGGS